MLKALFWSLLVLGLYPYVIYPVLVVFIGRLRSLKVARDDGFLPRITIITAAYNEKHHIGETVRNKLAQDYPPELMEILVVSDESTDGTDEIVTEISKEDSRVRLLRNQPRQGKTAALNFAVPQARGDIIVFSDANSVYRPDAIRKIVRNFADPAIGYVTGSMRYVNADGSLVGDGCSAYMRYENALRAAETRVGSIVGVDGGVDAVRRVLYKTMKADLLPDFVLPLAVIEQRHRVIYEPDAILTEHALSNQADEYKMRVRVALRAFWALWEKRSLLNPLSYGLFSWQLWSHKVLRYISFLPLGAAAGMNWMLFDGGDIYRLAALAQVAFAVLVVLAIASPRQFGQWSVARYCYYFALLNWAGAVAFVSFLRGEKKVIWQPRGG